MFLQAIAGIGYADVEKVKAEIDRAYKNPVVCEFLDELSVHISSDQLVPAKQWKEFVDVQNDNSVLPLGEVNEALRIEAQRRKDLEDRQCVRNRLHAAQSRKALLEQQLKTLETTCMVADAYEDDLQAVTKSSHAELDQLKAQHKDANLLYSQCVSCVTDDCSSICSSYKNTKELTHLSHVDLDGFLHAETLFTNQLTQFAKKQFQEIPILVESLSKSQCELFTIEDTVLLQDDSKEVKQAILEDLRRATQGYASRKKRSSLANAELQKAKATLTFLRKKLKSLKENRDIIDSRHAFSLRSSLEQASEQSIYLIQNILPSLISQGVPKLRNHVLTGDFEKRLLEQRRVMSKQKKLTEFLLQQCARLSLIWMMLFLERTQVTVTSSHAESFRALLNQELDASVSSARAFNAVRQIDNSNKEPKAVIDQRDTVLLDLHKVLTAASELSNSSMFQTFDSLHKSAKALNERSASISCIEQSRDVTHLRNLLHRLHWNNSDSTDDYILLSAPDIAKRLKRLEESVSDVKLAVPNLISKVDKKRAHFQRNPKMSQARHIWLDFITQSCLSAP